MKKLLAFILSLSVILSVFSISAAFSASATTFSGGVEITNLITNGDFEDPTSSHMNGWTSAYTNGHSVINTSNNNNYYYNIPAGKDMAFQTISTIPVGNYCLKFKTKASTADVTSIVRLHGNGDWVFQQTYTIPSNSAFTEISVPFSITTETSYTLRIGYRNNSGAGEITTTYSQQIDDVRIERVYLLNGDFEAGSISPWYAGYQDYATKATIQSDGGNSMLKIAPNMDFTQQEMANLPAGKYRLTFTAKAYHETPGHYDSEVWVFRSSDTKTVIKETFDMNTYGTTTYTYYLTIETAGNYYLRIGRRGEDVSGKLIDNVKIENIPDNFVTNGDFSKNTMSGWSEYSASHSIGNAAGNYYLNMAAYTDMAFQRVKLPVGDYRLRFKTKADSADVTSIARLHGNGNWVFQQTYTIPSTSEFTEVSIPFSITAEGEYTLRIGYRSEQGGDPKISYAQQIDDVIIELIPVYKAHSLLLTDAIGVNFFMDLSKLSPQEKESSYMTFTVSNSAEKRADYNSGFLSETGDYYGYTCYLSSVQMAETVTPTFHYGDGKTIEGEAFSVKAYADYVNDHSSEFHANVVNLVNAICNYGYHAQQRFTNKTFTALDASYAESYTEESYTNKKSAVSDHALIEDNGLSNIVNGTAPGNFRYNLNLDSTTSILIYFVTGDVSFTSITMGEEPYSNWKNAFTSSDCTLFLLHLPISRLGDKIVVSGTADNEDFTITWPSSNARVLERLIPASAATNNVPAGSGVAARPTIAGSGLEKSPRTNTIEIIREAIDWALMSRSMSEMFHFERETLLCKNG